MIQSIGQALENYRKALKDHFIKVQELKRKNGDCSPWRYDKQDLQYLQEQTVGFKMAAQILGLSPAEVELIDAQVQAEL